MSKLHKTQCFKIICLICCSAIAADSSPLVDIKQITVIFGELQLKLGVGVRFYG